MSGSEDAERVDFSALTVADVSVAVGFALAENTSASCVVEFQEWMTVALESTFNVLAASIDARLLFALINIVAVSSVRCQFISVVARTIESSLSVDAGSMFTNSRIVTFRNIMATSQIFSGVETRVADASESSNDVQAPAVLAQFIVLKAFVVIFTSLLCRSDPVAVIAAASEASLGVDALAIFTKPFLHAFVHINTGNHVFSALETRIAVTRVATEGVLTCSVLATDVSLSKSIAAFIDVNAAFEIWSLLETFVTLALVVSASIDRSADAVLAARHRSQHLADVVVNNGATVHACVFVFQCAKRRAFLRLAAWDGEAFSEGFLVSLPSERGAAAVGSLGQTIQRTRAHLVLNGRVAVAGSIKYTERLVTR